MTRQVRPDPVTRWADQQLASGLDAELGDAFRSLQGSDPMAPASLAAVGRRIAQRRKPATRRPLRFMPLVLAVLTCSAGAAFAQWANDGGFDLQPLFARLSVPPGAGSAPRAVAPRPTLTTPAEPGTSSSSISPPPALTLPPSEPVTSARAPLPVAPAARPSALSLEAELLQKAFSKLRREHDAAAALVLLDEYQSKFPKGVLSLEASVARIDALLMAGRRADALERLSRLPLERVGRRVELQLLRAELLAERDCTNAIVDFSSVLGAAPASAFGERALYGRATCRLRSGDSAGGRADLETYLVRFPQGRFAAQVRARARGQ